MTPQEATQVALHAADMCGMDHPPHWHDIEAIRFLAALPKGWHLTYAPKGGAMAEGARRERERLRAGWEAGIARLDCIGAGGAAAAFGLIAIGNRLLADPEEER